MTVQYVRLKAYTKSVARRHRDAARSRGLHGPGTRAGRRAARPGPFVPKEGTMSTEPAVTMQDLELEHAELLPTGKPSGPTAAIRATASPTWSAASTATRTRRDFLTSPS